MKKINVVWSIGRSNRVGAVTAQIEYVKAFHCLSLLLLTQNVRPCLLLVVSVESRICKNEGFNQDAMS